MPTEQNGSTKRNVFVTNGCTNHSKTERQNEDLYVTDPRAVEMLLEVEKDLHNVWEPCCGLLHIAKVLESHGILGRLSDILNRPNDPQIEILDFLSYEPKELWHGSIVTNPPYKYCEQMVRKALESVADGEKVAMFLKLTFLEGKSRKKLFEELPFKTLYVSSSRLSCPKNGIFETQKLDKNGNPVFKDGKPVMEKAYAAIAYGWYVWEKGFKGDPIIKWIN